MPARRLLTTLLAAAMFSTSCATLTGQSQTLPPPPAVDETINTAAEFPDDGLTRLIVQPTGAPAVDDLGVEATGVAPGAVAPADPSRLLTPEMVAAMPPGAILEARDGEIGYLDEDGNWFRLERPEPPVTTEPVPSSTSTTEPEPEVMPLYGNPYIDELAADPAVERVIVIGDGTYGIETTDPSVVDPVEFEITDDVPFGIAQDPYEPYQWYLENDGTSLGRVARIGMVADADVDAFETIDAVDGGGVVVAVIDTGVDFSHPDLADSAWANLDEDCDNGIDDDGNGFVDDCVGWDFVGGDPRPYERGGHPHGTHVAGIITANRDGRGVAGVAPNARIMDLNVAYRNGSMSGAAVTAAIRYAVDNGADIINMSLGTNPGASAAGMGGMVDAIDYAGENGVLVVVAAGNSNVDIGSLAVYPASFDRPNMIVVGASAPDDSKASFSNFNSSIVDLYAPGVIMLSTMPRGGYRFMSGTSQAAPAAAATAALLIEASPNATIDEIAAQLSATVDQVDGLSSSITGGRLNAASALGLGDAPALPAEPVVSVSGLVEATNDVSAEVELVVPANYFTEEYRWELTLIQATEAGAYVIVEHPFVVGGQSTATGLTGAFILGPSATKRVDVLTSLPNGQYSFLIEAVPTAAGNQRLGDAFVTTFVVDGSENEFESTTTTTAASNEDTSTDGAPVETPGSESSTTTSVGVGAPTTDGSSGDGQSETTAVGGTAPSTVAPESGATVTTAPILTPTTPPAAGAAPTTTVPSFEAGTPTETGGSADDGESSSGAPDSPGTTNTPGAIDGDEPIVTAPVTSSPTDRIPSEPAPVPPEVESGEVAAGEWAIDSITPQAGYVGNANRVTLRGSFPSQTYVWFGDQPGQVVSQSDDFITVRTPLRREPGVVDVSLRTAVEGQVLTSESAYAFVAVDGVAQVAPISGDDLDGTDSNEGAGVTGTSTTTTGTGSTGGDSGAGAGSTGTTSAGSADVGDAAGGTDGGSGGDGSADGSDGSDAGDAGSDRPADGGGDESVGQRSGRMAIGTAVPLANGLRGGAISPNPAEGTPVCTADPCSAVRR